MKRKIKQIVIPAILAAAVFYMGGGKMTVAEAAGNAVMNETTGNAYPGLEEAVAALTGDAKLKLVDDVTVTAPITLDKGYSVTIVSEGSHTILRDSTYTGKLLEISNGSLTLGDGTEGGMLSVDGNKDVAQSGDSAVYNGAGGTLTLKDGAQIINNRGAADKSGSGVFNYGRFVMDGGKIEGNEATSNGNGGGVMCHSGASFVLNGGTISDNQARIGGGILVYGGSSFHMTGGSIEKNKARVAGSGAAFQDINTESLMEGGQISENLSSQQGTGVWNTSGAVFRMTGGAITKNEYSGWGGGVFNDSKFYMTAGEISENLGMYGGGVCNRNQTALFRMTGGKMENNLSRQQRTGDTPWNGSAINNSGAGARIELEGAADISCKDSIYISDKNGIYVTGALTAGNFAIYHSKIKFDYSQAEGDITLVNGDGYSLTEADRARFMAYGPELLNTISEKQYFTKLDTGTNKILSAQFGITVEKNGVQSDFTDLKDAVESVAAGESAVITLKGDMFLGETVNVAGNVQIAAQDNRMIYRDIHNNNYLGSSGRFTGYLFQTAPGSELTIGSGITLNGNAQEGVTDSSIYNQGTLRLTGGASITNAYAIEGSALINEGTCILEECTISGNKADDKGAVVNAGTMELSGKVKCTDTMYLSSGHPAALTGSLDQSAAVSVYSQDDAEGTVVIQGDGYSITDGDKSKIQLTNSGYMLVQKGNNLVIAAGSSAPSTEKQMKIFKFAGTGGTIDEAAHKIYIKVPYGTDITAMTAEFEVSDEAVVKIGEVPQVSKVTVNDFSNPVVYTVVAEDGSTQTYTVIVTVGEKPGSDSDPAPGETPNHPGGGSNNPGDGSNNPSKGGQVIDAKVPRTGDTADVSGLAGLTVLAGLLAFAAGKKRVR